MSVTRILGVVALVILAYLIGSYTFPKKSWAQDGHHGQGHAENHDWYQDLKQPGTGYSCCNGRTSTSEGDCRQTRAYQVAEGGLCGSQSIPEGQWCALIDGYWTPVPPAVVLKQLAPDGKSHICAKKRLLGLTTIYCFLGGSPKS